jgi:carboxyl-terminal processing protease
VVRFDVSSQEQKEHQKSSKLSLSSIDEIFYLVKKEFVSDIDMKSMIVSSMKELKKILPAESSKLLELPRNENIDVQICAYRKNLSQILELYGEKVGRDSIIRAAINGLIESLNDPYTVYFDEDEYERFNSSLKGGNFYGIGVLIEIDKGNDNKLTVVEPMKNTPADRAGIKKGDVVVKIDSISTKGLSIDEAIDLLRGPRGSPVHLFIKRKNLDALLDIEIVRDKIHISSVESSMLDDKIGYIKLSVFGEDTNKELEEALKYMEKSGAKGYILDLRNNGGGYVVAALDVCSKFMPPNSVVVYIKSRKEENTYNTYGSLHKSIPLAVLVNESSASASEITAGALQDSKRAVIIGVKTYGKGKVQTIYELDRGGGAIKITTAYYMTPDRKNIDKKGLEPDIKVEMDSNKIGDKEDIQLKKAEEYLLEYIKS